MYALIMWVLLNVAFSLFLVWSARVNIKIGLSGIEIFKKELPWLCFLVIIDYLSMPNNEHWTHLVIRNLLIVMVYILGLISAKWKNLIAYSLSAFLYLFLSQYEVISKIQNKNNQDVIIKENK